MSTERKDMKESIHAHLQASATQQEKFSERTPDKIKNVGFKLHDGKFLLEKSLRDAMADRIKRKRTGWCRIENRPENIFITPNNEAFVFRRDLLLGEGKFGEVYLAQNVLTGKWHCIKILEQGTLEEMEVEILMKEGMYVFSKTEPKEKEEETSWTMMSPDEPPLNKDFLISELVHGVTLLDFLEKTKLSFEQAFALSLSLIEAYESLHSKGYIHRDINPKNIMVDSRQLKCIAIDFGQSALKNAQVACEGTYQYMTLETLNDAAPNFKDDIYAMGLVAALIISLRMKPSLDQQISLSDLAKERAEYVNAIVARQEQRQQKKSEKETSRWIHDKILPVVLAAKQKEYQETLTNSEKELCILLEEMTGPPETRRDNVSKIASDMRKIRENHIKTRIKSFSPENDENKALQILYATREGLLEASKINLTSPLLDGLDTFLLRCVDEKRENRPIEAEITQFTTKIKNALTSKEQLVQSLNLRFTPSEQQPESSSTLTRQKPKL